MLTYGVSSVTVATAATADHGIAMLWNASTTRAIAVKEIHVFKTTAGAADICKVRRASARGTAGSTITPTIVNDYDRALAPASGALLDLAAFSGQPTFEALDLHSVVLPAVIGAGMMWQFSDPIWVRQSAGLAIVTGSALAFPVSRVAFVWQE